MLDKLGFRKSKELDQIKTVEPMIVPEHIAIIMDGNGRWARKRNLPRIAGHHEGMKVVRKIVREADRLGVKFLTLYAFSTENWKRPKEEVEFLMKLPGQFLNSYLKELVEKNVQVRIMGDESQLPAHTRQAVEKAKAQTVENNGLILNFALNYGSRNELTLAMRALGEKVKSGELRPQEIDEAMISDHLLSHAYPDPDLLIRTSGELRLSNFMLWQLAYTELVFSEVYWPDFSEINLQQAIQQYSQRSRRYGGV